MNFLYYANDSTLFVNIGPGVTTSFSFVFMLTLIYTCTEVCRIQLEVNLNKNSWVLGLNARSGSASVVRELSCFERERWILSCCCCMPTLSHQSRATNYCYISSFTLQHLFTKIVADFQAALFLSHIWVGRADRDGWERQSEFWSLKETLWPWCDDLILPPFTEKSQELTTLHFVKTFASRRDDTGRFLFVNWLTIGCTTLRSPS